MLSVVVPAYNEEENIAAAAQRITRVLAGAGIDNEIIFVDDGSADSTWEKITAESKKRENIKGISFSRNFGKEAAILAGLSESRGECCAVLDCDLQHPPEKLVEMYALWEEGYEVVEGVKSDRGKEGFFYKAAAGLFYRLMSGFVKIDMMHSSDFKLLDRRAVDVIVEMPEHYSFFRALSAWVGFKTASVSFDVAGRNAGETKWSKKGLVKYAFSNITSFSSAPMKLITFLGVVILVFSLVFGIISLVQKICGVALGGFTTVILMLGFIGSIIMISLGIIGYYISRIYEELKGRPRFIVSHRTQDAPEVFDKETCDGDGFYMEGIS